MAVEVYAGNTGDPTTVADQVNKLRERFQLSRLVLVGDRGMLTHRQINQLKAHPQMGWITPLPSVAIRGLLAEGSLQPSLLDERNLVEIQSPDDPGERLMVCDNPWQAEQRRRKREELLAATEKELTRMAKAAERRTHKPLQSTEIALRVGKVLGRYKMGKHFQPTIEEGKLSWSRRTEAIADEARVDSIYVIRTREAAEQLSAADTYGTQLQESGAGGAGLPQFEGPGSIDSPHSPSHRTTSTGAYFLMPVGLLPGVASATGRGSPAVRGRATRRATAPTRPDSARPPLGFGAGQEVYPTHCGRASRP